jgi:hypothetical protein
MIYHGNMRQIEDSEIKRIFRLKREIHQKPAEESIIEDIMQASKDRARTRITVKTVIVIAELVILAGLAYLYFLLK